MMKPKIREWIKASQLESIKNEMAQALSTKNKATIPFERIMGILGGGGVKDPQNQHMRLVWSRASREAWISWGLAIGVRNKKGVYTIQVVDRTKWEKAISGRIAPVDIPEVPEPIKPDPSDDPLIPISDPLYSLPAFAGDLLKSIEAGERVMLVGPCGSGKSSLVRELAARANAKFMRVNLNGESSVSSLIGQYKIAGKEMVFSEGPITKAAKEGVILCADEIDAATPAVLFCVQALLEENGRLLIEETGEYIQPHKDFRIVATANTRGKGDDSGLYAGTNVLNEATLDRFHCVFEVDYLPHVDEVKLLLAKAKGINKQIADRMVKAANDLRKALKDGVIFSTFSTRRLIAWANKTNQLGCPKKAALYTVINRLSEDDRKVVTEVLQRHGF